MKWILQHYCKHASIDSTPAHQLQTLPRPSPCAACRLPPRPHRHPPAAPASTKTKSHSQLVYTLNQIAAPDQNTHHALAPPPAPAPPPPPPPPPTYLLPLAQQPHRQPRHRRAHRPPHDRVVGVVHRHRGKLDHRLQVLWEWEGGVWGGGGLALGAALLEDLEEWGGGVQAARFGLLFRCGCGLSG